MAAVRNEGDETPGPGRKTVQKGLTDEENRFKKCKIKKEVKKSREGITFEER